MIVIACQLDLLIPDVQTLKEKRQILRSLMSRTRNQFALAIAEVGAQDLHQRTKVGFSFVGNDTIMLHRLVDQTVLFIEDLHLCEILSQQRELLRL